MEDNYKFAALLHWIAASYLRTPRNDGGGAHNRHCEGVSPRQSSATKRRGIKQGFSLIELLISLIVISLIASAFVPIYTKKLAKNTMTVKIADARHGLQIYTNPGSYAFDIPEGIDKIFFSGAAGGGGGAGATKTTVNKSFTANSTFTVPNGVNKVTFTITGAGGGGGAANGVKNTLVPWQQNCRTDELRIIRGDANEKDICMTKRNLSQADIGRPWNDLAAGQSCTNGNCCWKGNYGCTTGNGNYSGCNRYICTASTDICAFYNPDNYSSTSETATIKQYELPSMNTLQKIKKYLYEFSLNAGSNGLQLCSCRWLPIAGYNDGTNISSSVPTCENSWNCQGGVTNAFCRTASILGAGASLTLNGTYALSSVGGLTNNSQITGSVRCSKMLAGYNSFSGTGGASGAQLIKIISVLPNDTFEFTIGTGGAGGIYGTDKNNGVSQRKGNGTQGGTTKIIHKRAGTTLGTYYVKGGFGGWGATNAANGEAISNPTLSTTCYANGNVACSTNSFSGNEGSQSHGGNGARVANTGSITDGAASSGGYLFIDSARTAFKRYTSSELNSARGQNAAIAGFGGGGGFTPPWACEGSSCTQAAPISLFSGGKGASGKIDISYDIITPGGGGGAGASANEIEYKVTPGERIVFTIGKGGDAGGSNMIGKAGNKTTVMENHIIFNPGLGGGFGVGGSGGVLQINSSKAKLPVVSGVAAANIGKGQNGGNGKMLPNKNFGFDGGIGGTTFLNYFGGCGGGIIEDENAERLCQTSSRADGMEAKSHNAVKDEFGGQGGGGGGVTMSNSTLGAGGAGSDGYLRIRWGD